MIHLTMNLFLQAAVLAAGVNSPTAAKDTGSAARDYATAFKQTEATGQPLVVLIGADWCPGCRVMKQTTMPQLEKNGKLSKVAFAHVNADHQSELAGKLMRGGSIPQLVLFQKTDKGWKRQQLTGAQSASDVEAFIERHTDAPAPELTSLK